MYISTVFFSLLVFFSFCHTAGATVNADGPSQQTRLIFIHHSTGENWLAVKTEDWALLCGTITIS